MSRDRDTFDAAQIRILGQVAKGAPLSEVLDAIVRLIEAQSSNMLCSILVLDAEHGRLRHGAAPTLPAAFVNAIDGCEIGPNEGSCGSAAARREVVIVEDIATHPSWVSYRNFALPHGLLACWSTPILGPEDEVLGTFAMYYRETRRPTALEREWVAAATNLAAAAILRDRSERALRNSERNARELAQLYQIRVKELTLLHRVTRILQTARAPDRELLAEIVQVIPEGFQRQHACACRIRWENWEAATKDFTPTASYLAAPLSAGPGSGVLEVAYSDSDAPEPFLAEERELVRSLADMLSVHLGRIAVEQLLRERQTRAQLMNELGDAVRNVADPEQVLPIALRLLGEHLGVTRAVYAEIDLGGERITVSRDHCRGCRSIVGQYRLSEFGQRLAAAVRDGTEPLVVGDTERELSEAESARLREMEVRAFICCSLVRQGTLRAVLTVHQTTPRAWSATDVAILQEVLERCWSVFEQRKLEEQLRHAQKLEAIGQLAGGVAHDFNNVLSVILSYASFIADELGADHPLSADVSEIKRAGERAGELTRQLLTFSRQQMARPQVLELDHVVRGMENMLRRLIGEDIALSLITSESRGRIFADPGQVEQVIMNLVINARDAMPKGGSLTIETGNVAVAPCENGDQGAIAPADYVTLAVTDTGVGMDALTRSRIFEPFFTTKEQGKGTGLGLSTVYGIVTQSGGHVSVHSEPGVGTTFTILFPRIQQTLYPQVAAEPLLESLRGCETILVVEDVEQVRAITRSVLRRGGYTVVEAQNAGEALLICEKHKGAIHLLLTDVLMPHMSGTELAERVAPLRPNMQVLYMSGHDAESLIGRGGLGLRAAFLTKPITPDALLLKVREVLDARREATSELVPVRTSQGPSAEARGQGEHILHVDDEAPLVHLTGRILTRLGYRVTGLTEPARALAAFQANPMEFDALVTDVSMPGMGGLELAREVRRIRPGLPVVLVSGNFRPEHIREAERLGIGSLVVKPDTVEELGRVLQRALTST